MKKIGIEIEFTGVTRIEVVTALENLFNTIAVEVKSKGLDNNYSYHRINDSNDNKWLVIRDRSILAQVYKYKLDVSFGKDKFEIIDIDDSEHDYKCELVSPVLDSVTLPILFDVVNCIKGLGGITNSTCGIHVHIDKSTTEDNVNLLRKFIANQDSLFDIFNVETCRMEDYCKKYPKDLEVPDFEKDSDLLTWLYQNFAKVDEFGNYHQKTIRYYGLNMYALRAHNTIEFRLFNSSLDTGTIAGIIKFVMNFCYTCNDIMDYNSTLEKYLLDELNKRK